VAVTFVADLLELQLVYIYPYEVLNIISTSRFVRNYIYSYMANLNTRDVKSIMCNVNLYSSIKEIGEKV
jgi:hypothetical protein